MGFMKFLKVFYCTLQNLSKNFPIKTKQFYYKYNFSLILVFFV